MQWRGADGNCPPMMNAAARSFDDGTVCTEHPTFALALLEIARFTLVPAELIPPIVTG